MQRMLPVRSHMTTSRNRGPRWSSPKQVDRGRPGRMVYLPRDLHAALDKLRARDVNVSAIAEEALRAHPKVAAELDRVSDADPDDRGRGGIG